MSLILFRVMAATAALLLVSGMLVQGAVAGSDSWTAIGPYGGLVYDLDVLDSSSSTVYAVADKAGAYKTTDGGLNWTQLTSGLPEVDGLTQFNCVQVVTSTGRILLGVDQALTTVYRSDDGGDSWSGSSSGMTTVPHRFALAGDGDVWAATDHGVYVSANDGSSWTEDHDPGDFDNFISVAVDPDNPEVVMAGTRTTPG